MITVLGGLNFTLTGLGLSFFEDPENGAAISSVPAYPIVANEIAAPAVNPTIFPVTALSETSPFTGTSTVL